MKYVGLRHVCRLLTVRKRLLITYTLHIKQTVIIFICLLLLCH